MGLHEEKVKEIQEMMRAHYAQGDVRKVCLEDRSGHSNTIRSQSYKKGCLKLNSKGLTSIIQIDPQRCVAIVEPRVRMEELIQATIPYGLIPPVVPELKGITVGGAIMGGAGESSSHRWGTFNDTCLSLEILCGDGSIIKATPHEHKDLFYGISSSYGSLGILLSAEIQLIPAHDCVHLKYQCCRSPEDAIHTLQKLMHAPSPPDFLEGIVFSRECSVVIEGRLQKETNVVKQIPRYTTRPMHSEWYFQHVEKIGAVSLSKVYEEVMSVPEYLFRYDQGAFWIGAYLFRPQFLTRFIFQGLLKVSKPASSTFSEEEMQKIHRTPRPNLFWRTLFHPLLTSQNLWKLYHKADRWIHQYTVIQDFCIPEEKASLFLDESIEELGIFPIWLCPIKSTLQPQILAPHFTQTETLTHFIDIGIYGVPKNWTFIEKITKDFEHRTKLMSGRKVLYSRSYYALEEFWQIYSHPAYSALRKMTLSEGVFQDIIEKVLMT